MVNGLYKVNVKNRLESLNKSNISRVNKDLIVKFVESCIVEGLSEHRIIKYVSTLKNIALQMNIDFDKVEKEDLHSFICDLESSGKGQWLRHDYKVSIKKFYKWLYQEDYPELTKWIKTTIKKTNGKLPEDIFCEKEVVQLIDNATCVRDRAIIALLWDIGARIGEIGNLKIKHITFDESGASLSVNGKTGPRRVRAVFSVSHLKEWLAVHPQRDLPDVPLWVNSLDKSSVQLRYDAIRMMLKRTAKRAGITKKIHPHLFRHSRATYMANFLTEAQMNAYFGWVQGSDMPAVYVHLSGRDVDDAVLKANGITKNESLSSVEAREVSGMDDIDELVEKKLKQMMLKLLA
jgi:site-specific recombinase XerD